MSKELRNCLTTILPILIAVFLSMIFLLLKSKILKLILYLYMLLSIPLVGIIILLRKEVFLKIWLNKKEKILFGSMDIIVWIIILICYRDKIIFIIKNILKI